MIRIGLVPGRLNPPHAGHKRLFQHALAESDFVFVVIIQGEKSGTDLVRNPLSFELKKEIINKMSPRVHVMRFSTANIPAITTEILSSNLFFSNEYHFSIYAGSDRVSQYANQIKPKYVEQIKTELGEPELDITFEVRALERDEASKNVEGYSASKIRNAIRNGEDEKVMAMLAIDDEDTYDKIRSAILAGVKKEAVETKINIILEEVG